MRIAIEGKDAMLRRLLERRVPRALIDRPKMGFGVPLVAWFRGPLRERMESYVSGPEFEDLGLDPGPIRRLWVDFSAGGTHMTYLLWQMFALAAWSRRDPTTSNWRCWMTNDTRPTARSGSTGRAGGRGPVAIVAAVTALALGGVATSVGSVVGHSNRQVVHATGESVPTSFGVVAVEFANVLTELCAEDREVLEAGAPHILVAHDAILRVVRSRNPAAPKGPFSGAFRAVGYFLPASPSRVSSTLRTSFTVSRQRLLSGAVS